MIKQLTLILLLGGNTVACSGTPNEEPSTLKKSVYGEPAGVSEALQQDSASVQRAMATLSENKFCESSADCNAMPVGERACGGPSSYMVYSKHIGDESIAKLEVLAERSKELARQTNSNNQMMSICQVLPAVSANCVNARCVGSEAVTGENVGSLPANLNNGFPH